jgi:FlaA1/EpsC-like NDP-sugar epimerase
MHYLRKIFLDLIVFSMSFLTAFLIRFDLIPHFDYAYNFFLILAIFIFIKIAIFCLFRIYSNDYNYFSSPNVLTILKATLISSGMISLAYFSNPDFYQFPYSIILIDWLIVFVLVCSVRYIIQLIRLKKYEQKKITTRVLIVGAGNAAESILREIRTYRLQDFFPVGLVDDSVHKQHKIIHNIKVLGYTKDICKIVNKKNIEAIIIAIPSATQNQLQLIYHQANKAKVKILTMPSLSNLKDEKLLISQLEEIKPEAILFRKQIKWDDNSLIEHIKNKRIIVTGAGGSIGSELCRQILKYQPQELLLLEISELNLFNIMNELKRSYPDQIFDPVVVDVSDYELTSKIINIFQPNIIFHAAAYKHVHLMELNPEVAIKNNVLGTMNIAQIALKTHVEKLVFISTDKAVNPTCIMGASKRIGEEYIRTISSQNGSKFFGVRFGNVLGSSGSVLEIFKEQIKQGGPVTVTHNEVSRYFMTIPEAVHLVLHTLKYAQGGEIFILDMGEPVRIYDMAQKVIFESGLIPGKDIDIIFTGLKPGEKLTEELYEKNEKINQTLHNKILKIEKNGHAAKLEEFNTKVNELLTIAYDMNRSALIAKIKEIVPTFQNQNYENTINQK